MRWICQATGQTALVTLPPTAQHRVLNTIRPAGTPPPPPPNPHYPRGKEGQAKILGIVAITPSWPSAQESLRCSHGWGQSCGHRGLRPCICPFGQSGHTAWPVERLDFPSSGKPTPLWLYVIEKGLGQSGRKLLRIRPRCQAPPSRPMGLHSQSSCGPGSHAPQLTR